MPNSKTFTVVYEKWLFSDYSRETFNDLDLNRLRRLIASMGNDQSSVLFLETDTLMMDISAGEGLYIVGCFVKEENIYYRLVGDSSNESRIDFLLGGQVVDNLPAKLLIAADVAINYAFDFVDGVIDLDDSHWELQM